MLSSFFIAFFVPTTGETAFSFHKKNLFEYARKILLPKKEKLIHHIGKNSFIIMIENVVYYQSLSYIFTHSKNKYLNFHNIVSIIVFLL